MFLWGFSTDLLIRTARAVVQQYVLQCTIHRPTSRHAEIKTDSDCKNICENSLSYTMSPVELRKVPEPRRRHECGIEKLYQKLTDAKRWELLRCRSTFLRMSSLSYVSSSFRTLANWSLIAFCHSSIGGVRPSTHTPTHTHSWHRFTRNPVCQTPPETQKTDKRTQRQMDRCQELNLVHLA